MAYVLPDNLKQAMTITLGTDRYTDLANCLDDLSSLNDVFLNEIDFNFDELEEGLNDIVSNMEDEEDIPNAVIDLTRSMLCDYLKSYGIVFVNPDEVKLYVLYNIIDVLEKLYNMDNSMMDEALSDFEETLEKNDEETFASIIADRSPLNYTDVYELVEYVSKDFFRRFIKYYQKEIDSRSVELSPEIVKMIDELGKIDTRLLDTYIIRYISKYGYTPMTFDVLEDKLYDVIQGAEYTSNADQVKHPTYEDIAREIVMFMWIATDTRGKEIPLLPDKISLTWADDLYPEQNVNNIPGSILISNAYNKLQAIVNARMGYDKQ